MIDLKDFYLQEPDSHGLISTKLPLCKYFVHHIFTIEDGKLFVEYPKVSIERDTYEEKRNKILEEKSLG